MGQGLASRMEIPDTLQYMRFPSATQLFGIITFVKRWARHVPLTVAWVAIH